MKYLLYDTETTNLDPKVAGLHKLSGMIIDTDDCGNFLVRENFSFLVRPFKGKMVSKAALEVSHVTLDDLRKYPDPMEVYKAFTGLLARYVNKFNPEDKFLQVGYCIHFDNQVLRQWFLDCGDTYFGSWFWSNPIDLMSDASRILANVRPFMKDFKKSSVFEMLGFDTKTQNELQLTYELLKKCWTTPCPIPLDNFDFAIIRKNLSMKFAKAI